MSISSQSAAMQCAEEIASTYCAGSKNGGVDMEDWPVDELAAIIAKHFPSPVAAEGDVERLRAEVSRLREALRLQTIGQPNANRTYGGCLQCGDKWDAITGEHHRPNCLAALSEQAGG